MTDRIKGLTVTLDRDYRDDDVETIVNAIMMVKGVVNVAKSITTLDDHINRTRIRAELTDRIFDALKKDAKP
jgi:hypothetical protein